MGRVTELIRSINRGDDTSAELFSMVYEDLRRIARHKMSGESPGHTLQPTALVNETFLKLFRDNCVSWQDRLHFFRAASEAMRRILIDNARRKNRLKRGGKSRQVPLLETVASTARHPGDDGCDLIDLHEALLEFATVAPENAELVQLHVFSSLTIEECAGLLGVSKSTAERRWRFSRAWLKDRMAN